MEVISDFLADTPSRDTTRTSGITGYLEALTTQRVDLVSAVAPKPSDLGIQSHPLGAAKVLAISPRHTLENIMPPSLQRILRPLGGLSLKIRP